MGEASVRSASPIAAAVSLWSPGRKRPSPPELQMRRPAPAGFLAVRRGVSCSRCWPPSSPRHRAQAPSKKREEPFRSCSDTKRPGQLLQVT
eukprot:4047226-Prymnesium_polylepis.2